MAYLIKLSKERKIKIIEGRVEQYNALYAQTAKFYHNGTGRSEVDKYPLRYCNGSVWVEHEDDITKGLIIMKEHYDILVIKAEKSLLSYKSTCANLDKEIEKRSE